MTSPYKQGDNLNLAGFILWFHVSPVNFPIVFCIETFTIIMFNTQCQSGDWRARCNLARTVELLISLLCTATVLINFRSTTFEEVVIFGVLLCTSASCLFFYIINMSSSCTCLKNISLKFWVFYALVGGIMFIISVVAYNSALKLSKEIWLITMISVHLLAGILYLIEDYCTIFKKRDADPLIDEISQEDSIEMGLLSEHTLEDTDDEQSETSYERASVFLNNPTGPEGKTKSNGSSRSPRELNKPRDRRSPKIHQHSIGVGSLPYLPYPCVPGVHF